MKLLLHHPRHHDQHGKHQHKQGKKGRKIMKKMAKLERKLSKYNFDSSSSEDSCSSDASNNDRSRSLSRSHKRRKGRSHHRRQHAPRFASRGRSSSSSSSASGSSSSSSSSSSRSPSPCERRFHERHHRHHRGPAGHLSRSKSFGGRPNRGPSHHRHHPDAGHRRGRFGHHHCRQFQDGLRGFFTMLSPENESNARETGAHQPELMDLTSSSRPASCEREAQIPPTSAEVDQDIQVIQQDTLEGPQIDETVAENWAKIMREGLPSQAKNDLLKKYPVSKNCAALKGPRLNQEILPVATETGVKIDSVQMHQQNQLGAGLTALGRAITDLNSITALKENQEVAEILEELNEAAVIIVDANHSMTKTRQALMQSELNKRVRPVVDNCKHDEFLYGKDFNKKIENLKGFGKGRKGHKKHEREGRSGKGEKRKESHQDGGRRCKQANFDTYCRNPLN